MTPASLAFMLRAVVLAVVTLASIIIAGVFTSRNHMRIGKELFVIDQAESTATSAVIQAFKDVLHRGPAPAELQTYSQAMVLGDLTLAQLQDIMASTPEYASLVGPRPPQDPVDRMLSTLKTSLGPESTPVVVPSALATALSHPGATVPTSIPVNPVGWKALSDHALSERDVGGNESSTLASFPAIEPGTKDHARQASQVTAYSTSADVGALLASNTSVGSIISKVRPGLSPWVQASSDDPVTGV